MSNTDYERDMERIERGENARNVSPECGRGNHELCECSALICRCECHRCLEAKWIGATLDGEQYEP